MKGTDIQRLAKQGHSFAIVNPRKYVGKNYRTLYRISRDYIVEARVQSLDVMYRKSLGRGQTDASVWVPATKEERSKGYLVRYIENGVELYYACASADFIDTWSTVDAAISEREIAVAEAQRLREEQQAAKVAEEQRRNAVRRGAEQQQSAMLNRGKEQMALITASALGEKNSLNINAYNEENFAEDGSYTTWVTGVVTLSYGDYARLLEKYLEALDAAQ